MQSWIQKFWLQKKRQKHAVFLIYIFSVNNQKIVSSFEANPSIFTAAMRIDGTREEAPEKQRHLTRSAPAIKTNHL